ncbi:MAG: hypothetical protein J3K34DRAFT_182503 [Monoraphidium minutum]|nr:MAG: hypothetical protein J3K34DRAFT_182503 [Monoraphidium minutum]
MLPPQTPQSAARWMHAATRRSTRSAKGRGRKGAHAARAPASGSPRKARVKCPSRPQPCGSTAAGRRAARRAPAAAGRFGADNGGGHAAEKETAVLPLDCLALAQPAGPTSPAAFRHSSSLLTAAHISNAAGSGPQSSPTIGGGRVGGCGEPAHGGNTRVAEVTALQTQARNPRFEVLLWGPAGAHAIQGGGTLAAMLCAALAMGGFLIILT